MSLQHAIKYYLDFLKIDDPVALSEAVGLREYQAEKILNFVNGLQPSYTEHAAVGIGKDIEADYEPLVFGNGYDHNWVLKNEGEFDKVAEVAGDESGIHMSVLTDLPGVQIYTANFLDGEKGRDGAVYEMRDAICLETQYYPDAIHHENFPGPICKKGEKYDTRTAYRFRVK